jgi:16S rRNA (cytidine1402-2'-O)-methyltransferase
VPADTTDAPPPIQLAAGLYVTATPIGNLGDVTIRALAVLRGADLIACEDTRITGRLLDRHGIKTRLFPYHEHNAAGMRPVLLERLASGGRVALVSDAGTPLISDPGYRLVREAREAGIAVFPVPGPSAVMAALSAAGLPTDRFLFAGFLPPRSAARRTALAEFVTLKATLVFFESAQRLPETLADMADVLGPRDAAVCRELTKLFEEFREGPLADLAAAYAAAGPPKGEVVIVLGPPGAETVTDADVDQLLGEALVRMGPSEAARDVAAATGRSRRDLYRRALALGPRG